MRYDDDLIKEFYCIKPSQFSFLDRLVISQDSPPEDSISYITVEVNLASEDMEEVLHVKFFGVENLKINISKSYNTYNILDIISIRERQMEYIDYLVTEREDNLFSFYCKTFEYEIKKN